MGVHYIPKSLASFVAGRLVSHLPPASASSLRVLDPACGDGALLEAFFHALRDSGDCRPCELVGVESDGSAASSARERLSAIDGCRATIAVGDFLDLSSTEGNEPDLWREAPVAPALGRDFDVIIANPPYVRTQVLGAERARRLARRFGLTGRVDLYHAFLVASTRVMRSGGGIGIITSNRFLSTLGGAALRACLASNYDISEIVDLGDTKIFDAAVLPAVFFGIRRDIALGAASPQAPRFLKMYSVPDREAGAEMDSTRAGTAIDVLRVGRPGDYLLPQGVFRLTSGHIAVGSDPSRVWALAGADEQNWLQRVRMASKCRFADVATVRVGIKTTADEIFIRDDWNGLPQNRRPEEALLHPLLTHRQGARWSQRPSSKAQRTRILYPHESKGGRRAAVELESYPRARAYLESHRSRLEARQYVAQAGRKWYEIWVPQNPDGWEETKIVFPDISPEPRFFLDRDGFLVNGDCYWLTLKPGVPEDMLYLILATANSRVMARYHDVAFGNKLYSARRRYITQYVSGYLLPDPSAHCSRTLIHLAKRLVRASSFSKDRSSLAAMEGDLDALVEGAFGVNSTR